MSDKIYISRKHEEALESFPSSLTAKVEYHCRDLHPV